jgi:peptidoglycan hydrolase-like protein with peptidoglycan-binding domain
MKKLALIIFLASVGAITTLRADDQLATVQQELKDQGYYYGQVDGQTGPETTAAIRRYQIRNGLQVDGTLSKETLDSLKIVGTDNPAPAGQPLPPQPTTLNNEPSPTPKQNLAQSDRDFLQKQPSEPVAQQPPPEPAATPAPTPAPTPSNTIPRVISPPVAIEPPDQPQSSDNAGFATIYAHTPYQNAPYEVQVSTLRRAQAELARLTFYNGEVDGIPGPGTAHALIAFQANGGLAQTGRLDLPTLSALRLLPNVGPVPGPAPVPVQRRVIIQPFYPAPSRYRGGPVD